MDGGIESTHPSARCQTISFGFSLLFFLISISAFREIVDVGAASIRPVGGAGGEGGAKRRQVNKKWCTAATHVLKGQEMRLNQKERERESDNEKE